MPRSSRHKSHKQSKHSSKDYTDSDEDVLQMKEKGGKDDNSVRVHRDSASGEKRKISSQVRESKDSKDLSGNGDVLEVYVSSKRRKEKTDVGGDRWNGGGDDRGYGDRNMEREMHKGESLKVDTKSKENSNKGENMRIESKNKSKRHESGVAGERKEDSLVSVLLNKEDGKSKGEAKRKSERDSSARREGKESKDKDRRLDKEKNVGPESKSGDAEDVVKKQGTQCGDFSEERQGKQLRENTERTSQDESHDPEWEKEIEKRIHKKREGSSEKEKHYDDFKEGDERRLSSRGDRAKDVKYRDDKHKDGGYLDKYHEDSHKDDRRRDEKYREDADKDNKHHNDKYREDGEKDARRRDARCRVNGDRDTRRKDEKHREDGERDGRRKDDKYREGVERECRRDDKYHEDGDRDNRRKDSRYAEDGDRDMRHGDEKYYEDGDRDDRRKDNIYRDEDDGDNRHKEEKFHDDIDRDIRHKDSKQGDGFDRDKRPRDTKHRDEQTSRDRSGDKSEPKRSRDDAYSADRHARKSGAYDDSPTHDDRTARYRDDQDRRRTNEKEDYGDIRSRGTKDQRSDAEKKSARVDLPTDRVWSSSRNAEIEHTSSHSRRRSSPSSSSHAPRDNYRALNQDEPKYRDYNYEERVRHNIISARDYAGGVGGLEKTSSSRSLEKHGQKDDGHLRSSPLQLVDKSPSSSTDRRQFGRPDVRRSTDVEESTERSGGSRDWRGYSGKEGKGGRELSMDVLPGEELLQADADTLSVSSPFMRKNHFSSSSKSFLPPPSFRTGVDSPLLGSAEEDGRGKSNIRHRRSGDPNMGRIQANAWRGVPNWPSPMANGFLPFPHAPPPVGFHSVMQPFPAPPLFGVRPSMELNHSAPYHIPDADRFSGPGRPMGWHNQVDDSCPPLHGWDASNAVYGEESHIYGRFDWDQSRNMPRGRGWETSSDMFKGPNRSTSMEMLSSEKENNSTRSGDEALATQSIQPAQSEQTLADQQADSTDISQLIKSFGKNDIEVPLISQEDTSDVAKISRKDDAPLCHVYFSKLDISADLTEPELFDKCTSLIDLDQSISSDGDDSSILCMEATEAKLVPHRLMSYALFVSTDDSIFQKSISLYKMQKRNLWAEDGEKLKVLSKQILNSDQGDQNAEDDKTEKLCPTDDMQGVEDALPNFETEADHRHSLQEVGLGVETLKQEVALPVGDTIEALKQPISTSDPVNMEETLEFDRGLVEPDVKEKPLCVGRVEGSDSPLPSEVKVAIMESGSNNDELKFVDARCSALVNSDDVSLEACEAMMPESIVSGSVNLSRIHHSPESTH
ncbi:filaggrin-like [Sesamum indicum]|uniref:Filaggrin-like n=1 Tax=Sesamum indicum TaxID=4182 RepID=A0A6I9UKR6_SESIN|nr:filaggrin-like [Sesamum indicum]